MQYSGNISKAQLDIFKRMVEGAKAEDAAEDYLRMALDVEIEDCITFILVCKGIQLKYCWVLDAIIVTCVQERTERQLELIAQFCEAFEVLKDELRYIAAMAKVILCMDASDYVTAQERKEDTVPDTIFSVYMQLVSKSCIYTNGGMALFKPAQKEDVTAQALGKIRKTSALSFYEVLELELRIWI